MKPNTSILAWHFSSLNKTLRYTDGRSIKAGEKLTVKGPLELCHKGLHASVNISDALRYAPGAYVWRVTLSGTILHGDDKSVATERTAIWGFDATEILRQFSRQVALEAIEKHWDTVKFGPIAPILLHYLKTGDESARSAAWSAAESAAWSARSAAESAGSAAWSAAESAAWSAAESAAWSARSAAESAFNTQLEQMIITYYSAISEKE